MSWSVQSAAKTTGPLPTASKEPSSLLEGKTINNDNNNDNNNYSNNKSERLASLNTSKYYEPLPRGRYTRATAALAEPLAAPFLAGVGWMGRGRGRGRWEGRGAEPRWWVGRGGGEGGGRLGGARSGLSSSRASLAALYPARAAGVLPASAVWGPGSRQRRRRGH